MNYILTEQSIGVLATELIIEGGAIKENETYFVLDLSEDWQALISMGNKDIRFDSLSLFVIPGFIFEKLHYDEVKIRNLLALFHNLFIRYNQHHSLNGFFPNKVHVLENRIILKDDTIGDFYFYILVNANKSGHFFLYNVTSKIEKEDSIDVDCNLVQRAINKIPELKEALNCAIENHKLQNIDTSYNLDTVFGNKQAFQYNNYEQWIQKLSPKQRAFFNKEPKKALKLRGPAGTGKTLVMELKAIQLLRKEPNCRILFTCHSWNVAAQVLDFIESIAPDVSSRVDVFPLLALAQTKVFMNQKDVFALGDDSFNGKIEQITLLSRIIGEYIESDWKILKKGCTEDFVKRVESVLSGDNNITWEIMIEISCTIGAHGFMPVDSHYSKYAELERRNWMMKLETDNEKRVVFDIYKRLMSYLSDKNYVTTDQIINDYINFLTTYSWYYARPKEGYNYIFVDEMQLFNSQEKLALTYLNCNINDYPIIIMALDPKQSIDELYGDVGVTSITNSQQNPVPEQKMGSPEDFCMNDVFRCTKSILNFLKHVDASYPTMGFFEDWDNELKTSSTKNGIGKVPVLFDYKSKEDEIDGAIKNAENHQQGVRVAILSLQDELFKLLVKKTESRKNFISITSKNTMFSIRYAKNNIYVSKPNYVIGLQFDVVILVGCYSNNDLTSYNQSGNKRRILSDIYLGASRAKSELMLSMNQTRYLELPVIKSAVDKGLIEKK